MPKSRIISTASCRVDLAGGTLDIWPLYLFHPGALTVNFAVSVLTSCEIVPQEVPTVVLRSLDTRREDRFADVGQLLAARKFNHALAGYLCREFLRAEGAPRDGFELTTMSESPAGAGISGSSALMVATTAALARYCGKRMNKEQIRVIAQNVEAQLIRVPTGCQDYYPALYGGVNAIRLEAEGISRELIDVPPQEIESRFVLVYTGMPRQSGINNWEVFQAHIGGNRRIFQNFHEITAIATEMRRALISRSWTEVSRLLREEWTLRKKNAPGITTPFIESLVKVAQSNGATAAKVCGAGGGGCVVFFVEPEARSRVIHAIEKSQGEILSFRVGRSGVQVRQVAE